MISARCRLTLFIELHQSWLTLRPAWRKNPRSLVFVGAAFRRCCVTWPWHLSSGFRSGASGGSHSTASSGCAARYSWTITARCACNRSQMMSIGPAMYRWKWRRDSRISAPLMARSTWRVSIVPVSVRAMTVESSRRVLTRRRMGACPLGAHVVAVLARNENPVSSTKTIAAPRRRASF
jgi:hypothetical protein